jgi:bacterioferritin
MQGSREPALPTNQRGGQRGFRRLRCGEAREEAAVKGDAKIIKTLNDALAIELTAINEYFLHGRMLRNWGYHKLAHMYHGEALEEMKHAEMLIDRILFLEGAPNLSRLNAIRVGSNVKEQLESDLALEMGAVTSYKAAVDQAIGAKDGATRELLERILVDSEEHVNWLESQLHVLNEVGLDNYLADQIGDEGKG